MFTVFEIKDSPAIPFEKVIKVDPIFHEENENKWGFSVHLGEQNKRCNFYLPDEQKAKDTRKEFILQWEAYHAKKYEFID
jgi:hypothetical protein